LSAATPITPGQRAGRVGDSGVLTVGNFGDTAPGASGYFNYFGTSFSTPIVAGAASLMLAVNPNLTAAQIEQGLRVSARPHVTSSLPGVAACSNDNPGRCLCTASTCGAGILDVPWALAYAASPGSYVPTALQPAAIDAAELRDAAVLPERPWVREQRPAGALYVVFVGPVLSRDAARLRREELVRLKMSFEAVELPGGEQGGYSLGKHDNEAAAQSALDALRERGLRNASVALLRERGALRPWLRLDNLRAGAADAVRARPADKLGGQAASACVLGSVMSVTPGR
jgi:Subtilase family